MRRQIALGFKAGRSTTVAQGGLCRIRTHNLLTLACLEVQALPLSYLLLLTLQCNTTIKGSLIYYCAGIQFDDM